MISYVYSIIFKIISLLFVLASIIIAQKTPEQGLFHTWILLTGLFSTICIFDLGIGNFIRNLIISQTTFVKENIYGILFYLNFILLIFSIIIIFIFIVFFDTNSLLLPMIFLAPIFSIGAASFSILKSLHSLGLHFSAFAYDLSLSISMFGSAIILLILNSILLAISFFGLGILLSGQLATCYLFRNFKPCKNLKWITPELMIELVNRSKFFFALGILGYLQQNALSYIVGATRDLESGAILRLQFMIAGAVFGLIFSWSQVFWAKVGHSLLDKADSRTDYPTFMLYVLISAVALYLCYTFVISSTIELLFFKFFNYEIINDAFVSWLILGSLLIIAGTYINAVQLEKWSFYISLLWVLATYIYLSAKQFQVENIFVYLTFGSLANLLSHGFLILRQRRKPYEE
jgi:O-antigen/teichoic acid export membrane protein